MVPGIPRRRDPTHSARNTTSLREDRRLDPRMEYTATTRLAATDAAVTMGPRNQRRLIAGAASPLVLAAISAAGYLLFVHSNDGATAASAQTTHAAPNLVTDKLIYGMTKAEVLHRIGKPTTTVGACWQYNENEKIRDGQNVLNAERVCFLSRIYSYDYSEIDGTWNYPTDSINLPHPVG